MADKQDIVDIAALRDAAADRADPTPEQGPRGTPWLSIWFHCCDTYGRIYRNSAGTAYVGRCPKCGAMAQASIGPNGTTQRLFEAW